MIFKMCAVFDAAVGAFTSPVFVRSKGEAIRAFSEQTNDPKSPFNRHPGDFGLFHICDWDDNSGLCIATSALPERLLTAIDALAEPRLGASL